MLYIQRYSVYCFKSLIRISNKFHSAIKRSRFICASRCCSYFFNFFAMLIKLIWSTSISSSVDIKASCTWIEALSYSLVYFFENELSSILITSSIRICEDDFAKNSRLQTWLHVSRSRLNIIINWTISCERNN